MYFRNISIFLFVNLIYVCVLSFFLTECTLMGTTMSQVLTCCHQFRRYRRPTTAAMAASSCDIWSDTPTVTIGLNFCTTEAYSTAESVGKTYQATQWTVATRHMAPGTRLILHHCIVWDSFNMFLYCLWCLLIGAFRIKK